MEREEMCLKTEDKETWHLEVDGHTASKASEEACYTADHSLYALHLVGNQRSGVPVAP